MRWCAPRTVAWRFVASLAVVRKAIGRFGQIEEAAARGATRAATALGLIRFWRGLSAAIDGGAARTGAAIRGMLRPVAARLSKVPVLGSVLRTYAAHYDRAGQAPRQRLSQKVRAFLDRWEMKFMPAYYEAKEKEKAAAERGAADERAASS